MKNNNNNIQHFYFTTLSTVSDLQKPWWVLILSPCLSRLGVNCVNTLTPSENGKHCPEDRTSLCGKDLAEGQGQVLNQPGILLLVAAHAWHGELTAQGNHKNHLPKEQSERNVLWSQSSDGIHTFSTTAHFLNSALKWAIILCFTLLHIIQNNSMSTFSFGKIKGGHGYLLNSSC